MVCEVGRLRRPAENKIVRMVFEIFFFFFFFFKFFVLKVKDLIFLNVPLGLFSLRRCLRVPLGDFESEKER